MEDDMLYSDHEDAWLKSLEQFGPFVKRFREKVAKKKVEEAEKVMAKQGIPPKDKTQEIIQDVLDAGMPRNIAIDDVAGNWKTKLLMMIFDKYEEEKDEIVEDVKASYNRKALRMQGSKSKVANWVGRRMNDVSYIFFKS